MLVCAYMHITFLLLYSHTYVVTYVGMVTLLDIISLAYVSVPFNAQLIKYGIVSIQDLCHDLHHWNTLYISGRLHKPVRALCYNVLLRLCVLVLSCTYMCAYVYLSLYTHCYVFTYVHTHKTHLCMRTHIHRHTFVWVYECVYVCICVCTCMDVCICTYRHKYKVDRCMILLYKCKQMYILTCICKCVHYVYMYACKEFNW